MNKWPNNQINFVETIKIELVDLKKLCNFLVGHIFKWIHLPCVWLHVFAGACIAGCNELVFGCCQPGSTRARYVFGYLRADVESGSHGT
jgi:hypothetical protein